MFPMLSGLFRADNTITAIISQCFPLDIFHVYACSNDSCIREYCASTVKQSVYRLSCFHPQCWWSYICRKLYVPFTDQCFGVAEWIPDKFLKCSVPTTTIFSESVLSGNTWKYVSSFRWAWHITVKSHHWQGGGTIWWQGVTPLHQYRNYVMASILTRVLIYSFFRTAFHPPAT